MWREGDDCLVVSALIFTLVSQCSWPLFTFGIVTNNLAEKTALLLLKASSRVTRAMDGVFTRSGKLSSG